MPLTPEPHFWPVDKVILTYFLFDAVLVLRGWHGIPAAAAVLLIHVAGALLLVYEVLRPNRTTWMFRHWYPVIYVAYCYRVMALVIPAVHPNAADKWLARADYALWHAHPTVWLERLYSPELSEYLQVVYTLFIPAVLLPALLLWRKRWYAEFRQYAFLIAMGYLVSYVGYFIVPARGPRFLLQNLQHAPLRGLWLFDAMQGGLDTLESAAYDCFPSGHTELTILAWWTARKLIKPLSWPYFGYTLSIIFATVYLRYHYTIDVLAGMAVAAGLLIAAPSLHRILDDKRGLQVGRS